MKERLLTILVGLAVLASAALSGSMPTLAHRPAPAIVVDAECQGGGLCTG